jgi:hypothetical protein
MRILTWIIISLSLGLAQSTSASLPLTASGNGVGQTNIFVTTGPWSMTVQSNSLAIVYLYDAILGKPLYTVMNNQVINETGTFFLYINVLSGSWSINVQNATTALTPSTGVSPTIPTTATTPTTPDTTTSTPSTTLTTPTTTPTLGESTPTAATTPTTEQTTPTANSEPSATPATSDVMSKVSSNDLKTWGKHYGFGISRYVRTATVLNEAVCSTFATVFDAQKAFFDAGGPETDIQHLDPDGDGYACAYNPKETYTAPRTCPEGKVWLNGFYRKNGTFRNSGCINKN